MALARNAARHQLGYPRNGPTDPEERPDTPRLLLPSYTHPHPPFAPLSCYLDLYRNTAIDLPVIEEWAKDLFSLPRTLLVHTGAVVISKGELHVANESGLATGSDMLTIGADGLLSGGGGRVGITAIEGALHLESPQAMTFADHLSLQAGSTIVMTHGAGAAPIEGDLNLAESVTLSLDGSGWVAGETYHLHP